MKKSRIKKSLSIVVVTLLFFAGFGYLRINANLKAKENACLEQLRSRLSEGDSPEKIFENDYNKLQVLVEESLVARSLMLEVAQNIGEDYDGPISSRDLLSLKSGLENYLHVRRELYNLATAYECAIDVTETTLNTYNIQSELRFKGVMLSLGAAITLYDNYLLGMIIFEKDKRLRKIVNDADMGFGLLKDQLKEMTQAANSVENRHRMRRVIKFYEQETAQLQAADEDSELAYLSLLIESSPAYNYARKIRVREIALNKIVTVERILADMVSDFSNESFNTVSGVFGNTLGLYESRKGKLYQDATAKSNIQKHLQPLDILLEKTPFRLTDKLIPGHFGHVAIWTGTKAELVDMNLWSNQQIAPYNSYIENTANAESKDEHQVIEALRSGVQLNTLDHFMNVDCLAVLRPVFSESENSELAKEAMEMAFRQLGKKYDFNFDVNTTDKIVCSELAYVSFPSFDWPTEKTLGRHNISPDNVAKMAWNNVPLKLVLLYHDGVLVPEAEQVATMRDLMN